MSVQVIVLAAGGGTRMKSGFPKVLNEVAGQTMLGWVLAASAGAAPERTMVVVGHEAEAVSATLPDGVESVVQETQQGTGHATAVAMAALDSADSDTIVVLPGDAPLLTAQMVGDLVAAHGANAVTLLTTHLDDPTGYGRVVRDGDAVRAITEHADATPAQLEITEVGTSVYAFSAGYLRAALGRIDSDNASGEMYLTDAVGLLVGDGEPVGAVTGELAVVGVNSYEQLAEASELVRSRINGEWMRQGVMMLDPSSTYIDATAVLAAGVRIYPGTHIEGASTIAAGASIGPNTHITASRIGEDAIVRYSVLDDSEVQARARVGPYAYLRGGSVLGPESRAGTHVELKNTTLAARAKVPHLSYLGDATVGEDANIGAGSITCNWDGYDKHPTIIGARARIGSDTMLVAPVEIGDDAWTGAGSVISRDVAPGSLAVERTPQKEITGYSEKRRKRAESDE